MTAVAWLLVFAVVVCAWWLLGALASTRLSTLRLPPIGRLARAARPQLSTPWRLHVDMARARAARAARAASGRPH